MTHAQDVRLAWQGDASAPRDAGHAAPIAELVA